MLESELRSRLIAHRGLWDKFTAKNSLNALTGALKEGFGIETDIRDRGGQIVLSHDPPTQDSLLLSELLTHCSDHDILSGRTLALNVKADGLDPIFLQFQEALSPDQYFFFDMSFPQCLTFAKKGLPIALRISEFEPAPTHLPRALEIPAKYWLDGFTSDWWIDDIMIEEIVQNSQVTVVSPELHGRKPTKVWEWFATRIDNGCDISLCTDSPFEVLGMFS